MSDGRQGDQGLGDAGPVAQFALPLEGFEQQGAGGFEVPLRMPDVAQLRKRHRRPPDPDVAADGDTFLQQRLGRGVVARIMGDPPEAMQAHGDAAPIADLAGDGQGVFVKLPSCRKLAAGLGDASQAVERTGDSPAVAQLPPDGERIPMSGLGRQVVALKVRQRAGRMEGAGVGVLPLGVGRDRQERAIQPRPSP